MRRQPTDILMMRSHESYNYGQFLTGDGNCKAEAVENKDICTKGRTYVQETGTCEWNCMIGDTISHKTLCPEGWSYFGCKCYKHVSTSNTWTQARQNCMNISVANNGGDLASVDSKDLTRFLRNIVGGYGGAYIGGHKENGTWEWTDGTPFQFSNWHSNSHRTQQGDGPYIELLDYSGKWNNLEGSHMRTSICQQDSVGKPSCYPTSQNIIFACFSV